MTDTHAYLLILAFFLVGSVCCGGAVWIILHLTHAFEWLEDHGWLPRY